MKSHIDSTPNGVGRDNYALAQDNASSLDFTLVRRAKLAAPLSRGGLV